MENLPTPSDKDRLRTAAIIELLWHHTELRRSASEREEERQRIRQAVHRDHFEQRWFYRRVSPFARKSEEGL
jgi:hypothetical protein